MKPKHFLSLSLSLLLQSCVDPDESAAQQELFSAPGSCVVAGAVPNDGIDDRTAIQLALTLQGCADLPSGVFDVHVNLNANGGRLYGGTTGLDRYDMLKLAGGRTLRGAGPSTVLKFSGDATKGDIHGVGMAGDENLVESVTLDTTGWYNTSEQSHAVKISGPALGQKISGVWFHHPSLGPGAGGDCIKVVGYDPVTKSDGTTVDKRVSFIAIGNIFAKCDRSGIAVHGGVLDGIISANQFLATGDQDLDLEGGDTVENLVVSNNVFRRSLNNGISVSLGVATTRKATLVGNVFEGGPGGTTATKELVMTYNVERLIVSGNAFQAPRCVLRMIKMSRQVSIVGNVFRTTDVNSPGNVLIASHHNSGKPGSFTITGNQFNTVSTNGNVVNFDSATDVNFSGNSITWTPLAPPDDAAQGTALSIDGVTQPTDSIVVSNNVVRGPYPYTLYVSNSRLNYLCSMCGGYRSVTFAGNIMRGPRIGLRCNNPLADEPIVSYGNSGASNQCAAATSGN